MKHLLGNLLVTFELYRAISLVCLILGVLCAIFLIIVVMMQSGNSNGIDALSGSSDTFYGKNKSKTIESKLKKLKCFFNNIALSINLSNLCWLLLFITYCFT